MRKPHLSLTQFISGYQASSQWRPAIDIYRYGASWLVKCELAGVMEHDIQLAVKGNYLSIANQAPILSP